MGYYPLKALPLFIALTACTDGAGTNPSLDKEPAENSTLTISLTDVVTLIEQEDTVSVINSRRAERNSNATTNTFSTNLFGLDEQGNILYPLQGADITVNMVVPGPEQFDQLGNTLGSNELWLYTNGINSANDEFCRLIRVNIGNGNYDCPIGNARITSNIDDFKKIRSDLYPVQFDQQDDIYLIANEALIKLDRSNAYAKTTLTPDSEAVSSFALLSSGEIVFHTKRDLKLLQDGSIYTIASDNFSYTLDDSNTIITGETLGATEYIHPRPNGGFNRAPVAHAFAWQSGNDGALYGWQTKFNQGWDLMRLLPYTLTPIVTGLSFADRRKLKLAQDFAYYTTTQTHPNYGDYDIIRLTNLTTRDEITLFDANTAEFDAGAPRYDIFNVHVDGSTLLFSALNQSNNTVKLGQINLIKLREAAPEAEYLSFIDISSAVGTSSRVRNMTSLKPQQAPSSPDAAPYVSKYHHSNTSLHALGVSFSKTMDKQSVEQNLSLLDVDNANASVEYIPFWIQQNLFLIPDTSAQGFQDTDNTPLKPDNQYQLNLGSNTLDVDGWMLSAGDITTYPLNSQFSTQPTSGFFLPDQPFLAATDALSNGKAAMLVNTTNNPTGFVAKTDYYDLGIDVSGNIRIEFSSLFFSGSTQLYVANSAYDYTNRGELSIFNGADIEANTATCFRLNYRTATSIFTGINTEMANACRKDGQWLRYRLDLFATNLRWSYSTNGVNYTAIIDEDEINDLLDRSSVSSRRLVLGIRVDSSHDVLRNEHYQLFDNIKVQRLNLDGSLADTDLTENTLLNLTFDTDLKVSSDDVLGDNKGFDDEVGSLYGATN